MQGFLECKSLGSRILPEVHQGSGFRFKVV